MNKIDLLFAPVDFGVDSEFRKNGFGAFYKEWKVKNSYHCLSASPADIEMGALLEFAYICRGALDDDRKFADVKFPEGFGELSNKSIDCKASIIRSNPRAAIDYCIGKDRSKCLASYFRELGIYQIHRWMADKGTKILKPCYAMDVVDQNVLMF